MAVSIAIPQFNGALISRLLRRRQIERLAITLRYALFAFIFLLLAWVIWALATTLISSGTALDPVNKSLEQLGGTDGKQAKPVTKVIGAEIVEKKNIFGPFAERTKPQVNKDSQPAAPAVPLDLIGTFVTEGERPYAIIEERNKKLQDVFMIGDPVFEGGKLTKVFADRVEILRGGQVEVLTIDLGPTGPSSDGPSGPPSGGETIEVASAEVDSALANLPLLMTQARAVPYFKDGQSIGLRLFAIRAGSLYEKIGLRNGDILKNINGSSLGDLSQALGIFQQLKDQRSLTVTLERNREERQFNYQIK